MKEKLIAIFNIIRPVNFVITFISVLVAALVCLPGIFPQPIVFLAALSASFTLAAGNIINDIYDLETDEVNRPERPLPSNKISVKAAHILYVVLLFISSLISFFISLAAFLIVLFSHILLFIYSKYLKKIPLIGNFIIALLTGLVFIFGGVVVENLSAAFVPAVFALLVNIVREIVKDMQDVEGDKKANMLTFPIKYGYLKSKYLITIFSLFTIAFTFYPFIAYIYNIEFFVIVMVIVNPILVYCLKKVYEDHSVKSLKIISNLLKLSMIFGLIAVYLGA